MKFVIAKVFRIIDERTFNICVMIMTGNRAGKSSRSAALSKINPTLTSLGSNPGHRGERQANGDVIRAKTGLQENRVIVLQPSQNSRINTWPQPFLERGMTAEGLPQLMEDAPLATRQNLRPVHSTALTNFTRDVTEAFGLPVPNDA